MVRSLPTDAVQLFYRDEMPSSLRVVHAVRSNGFAGVERSILLSSKVLVERGHQVTIVGGDSYAMTDQLAGTGIAWLPSATTFEVARSLLRLGRRDIVHAHMTAAEIGAVVTRPRHRAALVTTRHFAAERGLSRTGLVAARVIDRVRHEEIAISQYVSDRIGVPSTIVTHGLENREPVELREPRVVLIQRLEPEKHTDVALRAWAVSGLGSNGWKLDIAGDGAARTDLERLAVTLGVSDSVTFLGRVADVDGLRRVAAVQLATPPTEHFGLSVLEAMACGLPVVAADGGAHRELLGDSGVYFPPGDAIAAAGALRSLASDLRRRSDLGSRLVARQRALFSLASHGERLEAVYLTALASR